MNAYIKMFVAKVNCIKHDTYLAESRRS